MFESNIDGIILKFKEYGIDAQIKNGYIHFNEVSANTLLKEFRFEEDFDMENIYQSNVMIKTVANEKDTKLSIQLEENKILPYNIVISLTNWFNKQNRLVHNFIQISNKIKSEFQTEQRVFRPNKILVELKVLLKNIYPDKYFSVKFVAPNIREIFCSLNNNRLQIQYIFNQNNEIMRFIVGHRNYGELYIEDIAKLDFTKILEKVQYIILKENKRFKYINLYWNFREKINNKKIITP